MAKDCKITQKKLRPGPNPDDIKTAVLKVVKKVGSVRKIALAMNLKKATLQKHVNKYEKSPDDGKKDVSCVPRYKTKQVFTADQELSLENYLITSAKMHFGPTRITFAKFAYRFAVVNSITVSDSWKKKPVHGQALVAFFLQTREYVNTFVDNLEQVIAQLGKNYSLSHIYNLIVTRSSFFYQNQKVQIIQTLLCI